MRIQSNKSKIDRQSIKKSYKNKDIPIHKMNPIAFLLLFLVPTIGANRRILLDICSFDEATDGTFSVPFAGCALSTPLLIKNQKTIILNGGTPRHELQAAPGARHAIVTDGTFKISNLKLINGKGGCPNKNEGKK